MNRYENLISGKMPTFTIHDCLRGRRFMSGNLLPVGVDHSWTFQIRDSCFVDGELYLKLRWKPNDTEYITWQLAACHLGNPYFTTYE